MPRFNPLIAELLPPPIPAVQAWIKTYDGRFGPPIDLSQAVPGYPPHPTTLALLARAAADPASAAYGPIQGDDVLRAALATHQNELYASRLVADNIHITAGCNQAFICAALAVAEPGSRLLLTNPYYFNHQTSLEMFGIGIDTADCPAATGFLPSPDSLEAAITPATRAFAVVSPNNPTGAVYPPDLLARLFEICRRRGIWFILDETYRDFLSVETRVPHALFSRPDWDDTFVSLYSFSKSFCVPGYRLGAVTASPAMVSEIAKIMDNLQICAPRVGQIAVAEALAQLTDWREANRTEIAGRAACLRATLAKTPGWDVAAVGAYFAFIHHPFAGTPSAAVAERLAREVGVVTVPGGYFGPGQDDYLRFAFANARAETIVLLEDRLKALTGI